MIAKLKKRTINLLFIDDHKMILQGYETALLDCEEYQINFHSKTRIDDAYSYIINNKKDKFDIIFFDISMGDSLLLGKDDEYSGVDLANKVREFTDFPKVVFITGHSDYFLFEKIMQNINTDGILIKDELDNDDLKFAVKKIIKGASYYSESVLDNFKRRIVIKKTVDDIDIKIMYYLSKGVLTKNLHTKIKGISQKGLDKRKLKIKVLFNVQDLSDFGLVKEAKRRGLI